MAEYRLTKVRADEIQDLETVMVGGITGKVVKTAIERPSLSAAPNRENYLSYHSWLAAMERWEGHYRITFLFISTRLRASRPGIFENGGRPLDRVEPCSQCDVELWSDEFVEVERPTPTQDGGGDG